MVEFELAIKALSVKEVDFVIIGGVAISFHSSGYITRDLDFCYLRTTENLKKIIAVFASFSPHLQGFPEDLSFVWDERTLQNKTILRLLQQSAILICSAKLPELAILKQLVNNLFQPSFMTVK